MDNIQDQIRALQATVAVQQQQIDQLRRDLETTRAQLQDGRFESITCKKWFLADDRDRARVVAMTFPDGAAGFHWCDEQEQVRMIARTGPSQQVSISLLGEGGQTRVNVGVLPNGMAGMGVFDRDGNPKLGAGVTPAGAVIYPTKDGT